MKTLLNISIPTYNRPEFLYKCINSIKLALNKLETADRELVSIFISDNGDDNRSEIVYRNLEFNNLNITYSKNNNNIGSDRNIARCYLYENSDYVMILGDDDFMSENALSVILPYLKNRKYPIVFLKAYGLTGVDGESRLDTVKGLREYNSIKEVMLGRNINLGFISNMIFRRNDYNMVDVDAGIGTQLVQLNLVLYLLKKSCGTSLDINANLIRSTRNNTGGYDPFDVLYLKFFQLIMKYDNMGMSEFELFQMRKKLMSTFYNRSFAQYMRITGRPISKKNLLELDHCYLNFVPYRFFYRPLFKWNSRVSFYLLSVSYIFGNVYYNPKTRTNDFIYHFKNYLSRAY
jgi:abequosyltransferase